MDELLHNCFLHNLLNLRGRGKKEVNEKEYIYLWDQTLSTDKKAQCFCIFEWNKNETQTKKSGYLGGNNTAKKPQQKIWTWLEGTVNILDQEKCKNLPRVWGSQAASAASPHLWKENQFINQSFEIQIHNKTLQNSLNGRCKPRSLFFYLFEEPSWFFRSSLRIRVNEYSKVIF